MMSPQILDGKLASQNLLNRLANATKTWPSKAHLKIIQVGENKASTSYIRQKEKAAGQSELRFTHEKLPRHTSLKEIQRVIEKNNLDDDVSAFMLQLPLDSDQNPQPTDIQKLLESISPDKDADGLHTNNLGKLFAGESTHSNWQAPLPATALGIMRLLEHYHLDPQAKDAVVIGRSRLVGAPTATLLTHAGATVTLCHRSTKFLNEKTKTAEILIVAAGIKNIVGVEHIRPGAIIVDVGIHVGPDGKLSGDVKPEAQSYSSFYSPVPGGVGPMTVACLIENTVRLFAKKSHFELKL
ncbi:MAG: bifunctional 5,10-methylenetetrahydrofolate dehydrogenase/5,10-methenyltetrahydrofolate cyclohydrolase [Proteobacteria bacterium]|nr:bifunctional 5,10-methylenetetrahydrofolate dehydrogenase/5,10-methenyltetrahydrofolate cyclohydrolase [Pseudomonadota bacterium]